MPRFTGICGEKTFVLEANNQSILLQEFLPFVLSAERFHKYAIAMSRGSVNPYINWRELAAYEFDLPLIDKQKRLADLLWAVERHSCAIDEVDARIRCALQVQVSAQLRTFTDRRRLGDITSTRSGPSFPASAVSPTADAGSIPILGIPNTKSDGTIDLSDTGYVTGLPSTTRTVDEASLICHPHEWQQTTDRQRLPSS